MLFRDIHLNVTWVEGSGFNPTNAPSSSGLYAQVYWPDRAVRIGQSSNIRQRLREATAWVHAMHQGTAPENQLRRTSELCERVKETGNEGFEYFLISDDRCFSDHSLRLECEAFLFGWFESNDEHNGWKNWNREKPRKELMSIFNEGKALQPKDTQSGVVLSAMSVVELLSLHARIGEALLSVDQIESYRMETSLAGKIILFFGFLIPILYGFINSWKFENFGILCIGLFVLFVVIDVFFQKVFLYSKSGKIYQSPNIHKREAELIIIELNYLLKA